MTEYPYERIVEIIGHDIPHFPFIDESNTVFYGYTQTQIYNYSGQKYVDCYSLIYSGTTKDDINAFLQEFIDQNWVVEYSEDLESYIAYDILHSIYIHVGYGDLQEYNYGSGVKLFMYKVSNYEFTLVEEWPSVMSDVPKYDKNDKSEYYYCEEIYNKFLIVTQVDEKALIEYKEMLELDGWSILLSEETGVKSYTAIKSGVKFRFSSVTVHEGGSALQIIY